MSIVSRIRVCSVDEEGRFGGPESRITQIAKALNASQKDIDTHVVYPRDDSERFAQELSRERISNSALNITRLSKEKKVLIKYHGIIIEYVIFFNIRCSCKFYIKGRGISYVIVTTVFNMFI